MGILGKGAYGRVFKAFDHKKKELVALKIIRNKKQYTSQAHTEIKILTYIREQDKEGSSGVVKIKDFLVFRKHVVRMGSRSAFCSSCCTTTSTS